MLFRLSAFVAIMSSLWAINAYDDYNFFIAICVFGAFYICIWPSIREYLDQNILNSKSIEVPSKTLHNLRRANTYPNPYTNTWYHFCDSSDLKNGGVLEFRALGRVYVLWRDNSGKPVCQDAFCIHQGANLGVGGKVEDNCIVCPFHKWKFAADGTIMEVPYLKDPSSCQGLNKKQKTFHCMDWCGLVLVYFHADDKDPEFYPPAYVAEEFKQGKWQQHCKWNAGFFSFSPVDMVDQAGDHAHFQTLHADFMIPWTKIRFPDWVHRLIPVGICHKCVTYRGDDKEWAEEVKKSGWGSVDKHLLYFTDLAGLTWNTKPMLTTLSPTTEMFVGPSMILFHIPFTVGIIKAFVTTTPMDEGSVMRVRTWVDGRVAGNIFIKTLAWWLTGISASQLNADVEILENKIRLRKPLIQPFDGPYNRVNAWLKQFYSEGSMNAKLCDAYKNDW